MQALRILDRTPYTTSEVRDLNRSCKLLAKYGAMSVERLAGLTPMSTMSASWCLWHIGAVPTAAGLYVWLEGGR